MASKLTITMKLAEISSSMLKHTHNNKKMVSVEPTSPISAAGTLPVTRQKSWTERQQQKMRIFFFLILKKSATANRLRHVSIYLQCCGIFEI